MFMPLNKIQHPNNVPLGESTMARYSGGHGIRGDTVFGGTRYSGGHGNRGFTLFKGIKI